MYGNGTTDSLVNDGEDGLEGGLVLAVAHNEARVASARVHTEWTTLRNQGGIDCRTIQVGGDPSPNGIKPY